MEGEVANQNARRQRGIVHCGRCGAEGVTVRSCPTCRHLPRARIDNAADIAVNVVPPLLPGQAHLENLNAAIRDIDGDELGDENGEYDAPDDEDQLPLPFEPFEELPPAAENEDNDDQVDEPVAVANDAAGVWTEVPVEDVPARLLRAGAKPDFFSDLPAFAKSQSVGPNISLIRNKGCVRPVDFFELYFTQEMQDKIIKNSNWYGQRFIRTWQRDVSRAEFKAFLAIILELGRIPYLDEDYHRNCFDYQDL